VYGTQAGDHIKYNLIAVRFLLDTETGADSTDNIEGDQAYILSVKLRLSGLRVLYPSDTII
jgi:hypothetical protein